MFLLPGSRVLLGHHPSLSLSLSVRAIHPQGVLDEQIASKRRVNRWWSPLISARNSITKTTKTNGDFGNTRRNCPVLFGSTEKRRKFECDLGDIVSVKQLSLRDRVIPLSIPLRSRWNRASSSSATGNEWMDAFVAV